MRATANFESSRQFSAGLRMRVALAFSVLLTGGFSLSLTYAQLVVRRDLPLAYTLAPYDGRILAAWALEVTRNGSTPAEIEKAAVLTKRAVALDATAVDAIAAAGLIAVARGDTPGAEANFHTARKLTRRNLYTQLWSIENAVSRNEIAEAIHQYDLTLRVFPNLGDVLFPVLIAASGDKNIYPELLSMLVKNPRWISGFIDFISSKTPDPRLSAKLLGDLSAGGVIVPHIAKANMVNGLLDKQYFDMAWSYYVRTSPNVRRSWSRDPDFSTPPPAPSRLDWVPINDGGVSGAIENNGFDFSAPPAVGGLMLVQNQLLPRGRYRLFGRSRGIEQPKGAQPYWTLICYSGAELGRIEIPNSAIARGTFLGTFYVPEHCPAQKLMLIARPSGKLEGLSGKIEQVQLEPVGR